MVQRSSSFIRQQDAPFLNEMMQSLVNRYMMSRQAMQRPPIGQASTQRGGLGSLQPPQSQVQPQIQPQVQPQVQPQSSPLAQLTPPKQITAPSPFKDYNPNAPVRTTKVHYNSAADETNFMKKAKAFNEAILPYVGTVNEIPQDQADMQGYDRRGTLSAFYDPWTGKLLKGVDTAATPQMTYEGDNQTLNYSMVNPWEKAYKEGIVGEETQLQNILGNLPKNEREKIQSQYNELGGLRSTFEQKYLPSTLREQITKFMPEVPSKKAMATTDFGVNSLTASLAGRGITDFRQIGVTKDEKGKNVFYNKMTGEPIESGLHTYKGGPGNFQYSLAVNKEGNPTIKTHYETPSMKGMDFLPSIALAAAAAATGGALAPALASAMGGGAAATTAGGALAHGLTGAATTAIQGGDATKGFLSGAVGGGLSGLGSSYDVGTQVLGKSAPAWQKMALNQGLGGALKGGVGAQLSGQNVVKGALTGGVGGALGGGLGRYSADLLKDQGDIAQTLGRVGTSALTSGVVNQLRGGDFAEGLKSGTIGGIGGELRSGLSQLGQKSGLNPQIANTLAGLGGKLATSAIAQQFAEKPKVERVSAKTQAKRAEKQAIRAQQLEQKRIQKAEKQAVKARELEAKRAAKSAKRMARYG